jgi:hypothetical protein
MAAEDGRGKEYANEDEGRAEVDEDGRAEVREDGRRAEVRDDFQFRISESTKFIEVYRLSRYVSTM